MHKVSICIPIFNEEQNIDPLFEDIFGSELYLNVDEIIFIDDKSTDKSLHKINKISEFYNKVRVISLPRNKGQSYCLYTAINTTSIPYLAIAVLNIPNKGRAIKPPYIPAGPPSRANAAVIAAAPATPIVVLT